VRREHAFTAAAGAADRSHSANEERTMFRSITPLLRSDTARIEDHLLRLCAEDRSLRFAAGLVTDATIRRYVAAIPFERDLVLGLVSQRGSVFGLVHGCVFTADGRSHVEAAFSIDAAWRGHGLATSLMRALTTRVADRADATGATIVGSCAARNLPMRAVFGNAGMTLRREEDEIHAHGLVSSSLGLARLAERAPVHC
jgi:RimJ/RimL family protein N-acetyltransferase